MRTLALAIVALAIVTAQPDPVAVLQGNVWLDRVPPRADDQHSYMFYGTKNDPLGVYVSRTGRTERRETFRWSLEGDRLTFRFGRDGRTVTARYTLEKRQGDGFDYALTLDADPCRDGTRQTYLRRTKG